MTEGRKTAIFALVAAVIAAAAWGTATKRSTNVADVRGLVGSTLYENFTDPLEAASLRILRYNTGKEAFDEFEVTKDRNTGLWTIPSHESYPADANKQMADAATLFVGLKVLDVASEKLSEQALYGVLEPNKQKEAEGGDGVGMLVQLRDEKGEMLADLIIGKKDADSNKRFVRVPSSDVIYVCELDTTPLSTDFKSWIESDLLQLSANDIEVLGIRDYQILPTNQGLALSRTYEADVSFLTDVGQWTAKRIMDFTSEPVSERTLSDSEQLNSTRLSEIRNVLDNLKIVDVAKKPAGLAADLKGDRSKLGPDAISSLQRRGFFPNPNQKDGDVVDFLSKNGELLVTLRDGVQYLLRFGGSASTEINEAAEGEEESVSVNPYLLVTARLDESKFPEPVLAKVPETVEELKAIEALNESIKSATPIPPVGDESVSPPEQPATEATESEAPAANEPTATEPNATESSNPEATSSEPAADAPATNEPAEAPATEPVQNEEPAVSDDAQSSIVNELPGKLVSATQEEETPAQEPVAESTPENSDENASEANAEANSEANAADANSAEAAQADSPQTAEVKSASELTDEEWQEKLEVTRERLIKENTRKIDEREEKLKAARSKVNQLNRRFADWYYVISEADYNRLKLTLKDLVQEKSAGTSAPTGLPGGAFPGFSGGAFPGQE